MNLVIDIGNTLTKIALFEHKNMIRFEAISDLSLIKLKSIVSDFNALNNSKIKYAILSAVGKIPNDVVPFLSDEYNFIQFTHLTKIPIKNIYESPVTLGLDRLAGVVGASAQIQDKDLLVVDCGTCVTYDFRNRKKEYLGGGISPGIDMRFRALNTFTANLPLVSRSDQFELIENTTERAIRSGVLNGIIAEMDGNINEYKKKFPEIEVIFTGGDVNFFDRKLKNDIFANSNLVLEGLNLILEYNIDE